MDFDLVDKLLDDLEREAEAKLQAELGEFGAGLLELERFVVARWARVCPGPGMVGYLCAKAAKPIGAFYEELEKCRTLVSDAHAGRRPIFKGRNRWSHFARLKFLEELREARRAGQMKGAA